MCIRDSRLACTSRQQKRLDQTPSRLRVLRVDFERAGELLDGLLRSSGVDEHPSNVRIDYAREGIKFACQANLPERVIQAHLGHQHVAVPGASERIARIQFDGTQELLLRFLPPP